MLDRDVLQRLEEIQSQRRQGLLTQKEAYEQHMGLMATYAASVPTVPAPTTSSPSMPPPPYPPGTRLPAPSGVVVTPPAAPSRPESTATYVPPMPSGASTTVWVQVAAILLALVGGAFGVMGAFVQELYAGGGILLAFTGAPIIEEALKPIGVYLLLLKWPHVLNGRLHTALLAALGGLCFGVVESLVYVTFYFPEGGSDFVLFRFTVPVIMHTTASFIVGLGLTRGIFDWAAGRTRMPKYTRNFYFGAVLLHASYNILVTVLELSGVLGFD